LPVLHKPLEVLFLALVVVVVVDHLIDVAVLWI
jgi:hypothetical protein